MRELPEGGSPAGPSLVVLSMSPGKTLDGALETLGASPPPGEPWRVFGLRGGARPYLLARWARACRGAAVVVVPALAEAEEWVRSLRFFLGEDESVPPLERRVHWLPPWDAEPFAGVSP